MKKIYKKKLANTYIAITYGFFSSMKRIVWKFQVRIVLKLCDFYYNII